jgi:hypothetical protein
MLSVDRKLSNVEFIRIVRLGLSLWTAVAGFASIADPPSFEISQICSNLDGSGLNSSD